MYQISREKMPELLAAVAKEMDLFLPVQNNGITNFGFWTEDAKVDLDTLKTVKSQYTARQHHAAGRRAWRGQGVGPRVNADAHRNVHCGLGRAICRLEALRALLASGERLRRKNILHHAAQVLPVIKFNAAGLSGLDEVRTFAHKIGLNPVIFRHRSPFGQKQNQCFATLRRLTGNAQNAQHTAVNGRVEIGVRHHRRRRLGA